MPKCKNMLDMQKKEITVFCIKIYYFTKNKSPRKLRDFLIKFYNQYILYFCSYLKKKSQQDGVLLVEDCV